ncbi:hypothetical protein HK405_004784, partial [Cladochytrium tenue]
YRGSSHSSARRPSGLAVDDALRLAPLAGIDDDGPDLRRSSTFARAAAHLKDKDTFVSVERREWMKYMRHVKEYDANKLGVVPGSRGVVFTGSTKSVPNIITAVLLLRETGCNLPVQFSYIRREVTEEDLYTIRSFNISTRDFTDAIKDNDWGKEEFRLGGPKVDAILATPFEQVLFLDPDNYVLKDPTYLFDTRVFNKFGALFWPDFPVRPNDTELIVWDIFNLKGKYWKEFEFESGQIVLDKSRVWKALMLTRYISQQGKYYFKPGSRFCGQSMMQSDFYDDPDNPVPQGYVPQPLFMHWNMLKFKVTEGVDYFQSAMTYEQTSACTEIGVYLLNVWTCVTFLDYLFVSGVTWGLIHQKKAEPFHRAYRIGRDSVEATRLKKFMALIPNASYEESRSYSTPGTKGVVFVTSKKNIHNIIIAALLLRRTGCDLPMTFMYNGADMKEIEIEILKGLTWSKAEWKEGGPVASAILAAPYENIIFMEPETYLLRDPTHLFESPEFEEFEEVEDDYFELKAGLMVFNKSKVWTALKYVEFILSDASYFLKHMNGYKEAFYFGFRASRTPFFLNQEYPHLVGAMVDQNNHAEQDEASPEEPQFCGQGVLLSGLPSSTSPDENTATLKGLALQLSFLKGNYNNDVDRFPVEYTYESTDLKTLRSFPDVGTQLVEEIGQFNNCIVWNAVEGLSLRRHDIGEYSSANEEFREVRRLLPDEADIQRLKLERGVVILAKSAFLASVVRTLLFLRESGSKLPISVMYYTDGLTDLQVEGLRTFKIDVTDITQGFRADVEWSDAELAIALGLHALASSPFRETILLDATKDIISLEDPTSIFQSWQFRSTGAVFWPDLKPRNPQNALWEKLQLGTSRTPGMVFDSSHLAIDKVRAWPALMIAQQMMEGGKFITEIAAAPQTLQDLESDVDILFWSFLYTKLPFYVVPGHVETVGVVVDEDHPYGGGSLLEAQSEIRRTPNGSDRVVRYCGLATVQPSLPPPPPPSRAAALPAPAPPRPLFVRLQFDPDAYDEEFDFAQVGMRLELGAGSDGGLAFLSDRNIAADEADAAFVVEQDVPLHPTCVSLAEAGDVAVGYASNIRDVKRASRTRARTKDLDQIHEDLKAPEKLLHQPEDPDLPGLGQHYCVE